MAVSGISKAISFPGAQLKRANKNRTLNRVLRNPNFKVGRMLMRSLVIMIMSAGILSNFSGIIPALVLSSLLEVRAAAKDQKRLQLQSPRHKDVTVNE